MKMFYPAYIFDTEWNQVIQFVEETLCKDEICKKKVRQNLHPDVHILNKDSIGVDDIREIKKSLLYKPIEGEKSFFILKIKGLTVHAQNALLKILEEPPSYVCFILWGSPFPLLNTVRSRAISFHGKKEREDVSEFVQVLQQHNLKQYMELANRLTEIKDRDKIFRLIEAASLEMCKEHTGCAQIKDLSVKTSKKVFVAQSLEKFSLHIKNYNINIKLLWLSLFLKLYKEFGNESSTS
ncbi:MAG: hypothetical protein KAW82_03970 [Desulfurellaceae bacterium]|nr:hypothetical protein [Desulfurellaceae bacterium]